ncbi:hypothetical protein JXQ31_07485 [candidate division KSB1 bacterium]|nr:hypothetical protein [candidate division KSB1 bacterium]
MRYRILFILLTILGLLIPQVVPAQKLQAGILTGIAKPTKPLEFTQKITENGLEMNMGYNVGLKVKYKLHNALTLVGQVYYGAVTGEGDYVDAIEAYSPFHEYMHMETLLPYYSFGAGIEYELLVEKIAPYVTVLVTANSFAETDVTRSPSLSDQPLNSYSRNAEAIGALPQGVHPGVEFGMGFRIPLTSRFDIDMNVLYKLLNVAGNKENEIWNGSKIKEKGIQSMNLAIGFLYSF